MKRKILCLCLVVLCLMATIFASAAETGAPAPVFGADAPQNYSVKYDPRDAVQRLKDETKAAEDGDTTAAEPDGETGDLTAYFTMPEAVYTALSQSDEKITVEIDLWAGDKTEERDENETDKTEYLSFSIAPKLLNAVSFGDIADKDFRAIIGANNFDSESVRVSTVDGVKQLTVYTLKDSATVASRLRLVRGDERSEWSAVFAFGKDADVLPDIAYLDTPVLNDAVLNPEESTVSFALATSNNVRACAQRMLRLGFEQTVQAHLSYSINGGEWTEATLDEGFMPLISGQKTVTLPSGMLQEYSFVQLRMYYLAEGEDGFLFRSDDSDLVTASAAPEEIVTTAHAEETEASGAPTENSVEKRCPICGFCFQPLGICAFIWLFLILLIAIVIAFFALIHYLRAKKSCPRCGKSCKRDTRVCEKCGYRFTANMPLVEEEPKTHAAKPSLFDEAEKTEETYPDAAAPESFTEEQTGNVPYAHTGKSIEKQDDAEEGRGEPTDADTAENKGEPVDSDIAENQGEPTDSDKE